MIIYDPEDQYYYCCANKFEEKLGFFIIKISEKNPNEFYFLIKWKNKLNIGDPNMYIMKNKSKNYDTDIKELVISYKTIFMNTYNVINMDISVEHDDQGDNQLMIFRHESF